MRSQVATAKEAIALLRARAIQARSAWACCSCGSPAFARRDLAAFVRTTRAREWDIAEMLRLAPREEEVCSLAP